MTELIVFLLACYGVVNIVTGGRIFAWLRDCLNDVPVLGYWIQCPMCIGVPVGIAWCALGVFPDLGLRWWVEWSAAGMVSSGWCWMFRVVLHRLGEDEL